VGQVLVKPSLLRDVNEEFQTFNMEEASVKRKINSNKSFGYSGSFFREFHFGIFLRPSTHSPSSIFRTQDRAD
jgi:hypothetical protein